MRTLILSALILTLAAFRSDNSCTNWFPTKVGTKWELTSYDAKDKVQSRSADELLSVSDIDGGMEAKIGVEVFDKDNKSLSKGDFTVKCQNDKFYMDMSNMMPKMNNESMPNVEMEMSNQYLEFPDHPSAGQTLPDASSSIVMKMNGTPMMTTTITMTNRKVEGFEDVTTPAGTYHCVKYSYDSQVKSSMVTISSHDVLYLSEKIGMVKTESYDDKNNIRSKTLLTSYTE